MKSELKFLVNKIQLSGNGEMVEVDTSIITTNKMKSKQDGTDNIQSVLYRQYCNFVISYDEYIRMRIKVGDFIKLNISIISNNKREL